MLDVPLGEELEDAGALNLEELRWHVRDRTLLGGAVSDATLHEWWEFATRRQLLAPTGDGRHMLNDRGRDAVRIGRSAQTLAVAPRVVDMVMPDVRGTPMAIVAEEAHNSRTVVIDVYKKDGSRGKREVEPYSTRTSDDGVVRLHVWCLERHASRSFLVDNIVSAEPTGRGFDPRWPIEF